MQYMRDITLQAQVASETRNSESQVRDGETLGKFMHGVLFYSVVFRVISDNCVIDLPLKPRELAKRAKMSCYVMLRR